MVILGIDPGTQRMGYGLVRKEGQSVVYVDGGIVEVKTKDPSQALLELKNGIDVLIKKYKPSALAVEKLFFMKNQKTAMSVAEARGVVLFAAAEAGIQVQEYAPNEVKSSITGHGMADKEAVSKMVRLILKEPDLALIDDAMDALALAIIGAWNI